jgi:hypothetical protein
MRGKLRDVSSSCGKLIQGRSEVLEEWQRLPCAFGHLCTCCRSDIRVARVFSHSPSHGGSGSWWIVALIMACAARTGFRIMVVKTQGVASMPAVILVRRWTMRTTRMGALTKAAGAKDLTWREVRSTQAQNKVSSNSDKDIVEGGSR